MLYLHRVPHGVGFVPCHWLKKSINVTYGKILKVGWYITDEMGTDCPIVIDPSQIANWWCTTSPYKGEIKNPYVEIARN